MAYNRIKHIKQIATQLVEEFGYAGFEDLTPEDIDYIAGDAQCNYEGVCETLGIALPESMGPVVVN